MDVATTVVVGVIALIAGFLAGSLLRGRTETGAARHELDLTLALAERDTAHAAALAGEAELRAALQADLAGLYSTTDELRARLADAAAQRQDLLAQQRADQAERAEAERREHAVLQALSPVRETLTTMQEKISELERQRSQQYGTLAEQLKQAQRSDEQLRVTTESLASALRSNSTRGVWGETQLRRVVEAAGLTRYVDFDTQASISTDAGAGRPDMVIKLPGGKTIAVDAKAPLEHYIEASQIPVTASGEEGARRKELLGRHVRAVRAHVDALAKKQYWEGFAASPEFVVCFIPSESLLSSALEEDPALLDHAFGKRVALASPVNLWAVLKTVAYTWTQQDVSTEAKRLYELGNTLYQRLGTMAGHAEGLRRAIERTVASYNSFANSLESRVLVTARQFPGVDETKLALLAEPQPIHEAPRPLAAREFEQPEQLADLGALRERLD
ncbi:MAG: DNA recombination protein RmuC [Microbacteriaceae bacterium]|jgi:DNA recombination protein RmuC|nr:DNA recombination protein RmuC [Microbacteriaceae bacterium]HPZ35527.1 DNA recombination protein RmuC [Microbacteriaceae bacterium]HQC92920.1 DNA recombination protein RmuC [Microbacteriaceae bacterium]